MPRLAAALATASSLIACLVPPLAAPAHAAIPAEWVPRWRADLAFVADSLPRAHAHWFHTVPRERFRGAVDSLSAALPRMDHASITVELGRIVAMVGDGHTRLTFPFDSASGFFTGHSTTAAPAIPGLVFRHLPVRLRDFADGLHVVRTSPEHRALLGGRVVGLGAGSMDEARGAVEPTIQRDNDSQVRDLMPLWLVVPEILNARGVAPDPEAVRIEVLTPNGERVEERLRPLAPGTAPAWMDARDPGARPWADRWPERRHVQAILPGTTTLYARYREVQDEGSRTVAAFADTLVRTLASGRADRLILDVRGNVGGNGFLNRPLLHGIIAAPALQRPGALFVLADRGTFSAATMLVADLEKHAPGIRVGEKTGGRPNGYGDSRRVRLPNTGLTIRASTLYWQTTDPRDARDGFPADVTAEPTFADWRAGRDTALDSTLALIGPAGDLGGVWDAVVAVGHQRVPVRLSIAGSGASRRVTVDATALGAPATEAAEVHAARGELSFRATVEGRALEFRVRATRTALVGTVRFQGSLLSLVARRAAGD